MNDGWNLLDRRQSPKAAFFKRLLFVIVIVGFIPASFAYHYGMADRIWFGFFCGVYFFFLGRSYEFSDFTTVYPVARALPVFLVSIGDVLRGIYPNSFGWIGMLLVVSGCFLTPLYSFRVVTIRLYINRKSLWMLLAALGTVGYTMLCKVTSEVIQ